MMNIPGIAKVEYIAEKHITVPFVSDPNAVITPVIVDGFDWQKVNALQGTVGFSSSEKKTNAGTMFQIAVNGFVSGLSIENRKVLTSLSTQKHIFRLTDVNGLKYLVGTNDFKPIFKYASLNNPSPTGKRGYTFSVALKSVNDVLFTV